MRASIVRPIVYPIVCKIAHPIVCPNCPPNCVPDCPPITSANPAALANPMDNRIAPSLCKIKESKFGDNWAHNWAHNLAHTDNGEHFVIPVTCIRPETSERFTVTSSRPGSPETSAHQNATDLHCAKCPLEIQEPSSVTSS